MNKQQEMIFELMKWFHSFCEKNKLTYFMLGGTMLGSIRHSGFIPWDDDADFGMPRPDYERFVELTHNMNASDQWPIVESYKNSNCDFPYYFLKIYDPNTTLIEESRTPIVRGIYIDIFPLDGLGTDYNRAHKYEKKCFAIINFYNAKRFALSKKRSFLKNVAILFARMLPPYGKSFCNISKKLNDLVQDKDYYQSDYITNFFGAWQKKESMEKVIFGVPKLYKFESSIFYGPELSHEYLRHLYGNYMELPPIEKRGLHHSYIYCDLNEPYKGYKNGRRKQ